MVQQSASRTSDWKEIAWQYFYFWYFSGVVHTIIYANGFAGFTGIRSSIFMSALWLVFTLLFPQHTRKITAGIGLLLLPFALTSLGYLYIYHQEFSQSVLFIIFESNLAESSEYIATYFSWGLIACAMLYSLGAYLLWRRLQPVYLPRRNVYIAVSAITLLMCAPLIINIGFKHRSLEETLERMGQNMEPSAPWQVVVGYFEYRAQLNNMQALLNENAQVAPLTNLKQQFTEQPSTLVLVIGESTNGQRMSLYGYPRKTTPRLDSMKNELHTFNNAVAPRPYTIESLQQILTFATQEQPNLYQTTPSIMNLMKQAGYKTFWITNQQTITQRNTMLTAFSKQTDEQIYLNNNRNQNAKQYDGVVLAPFEKVLADPASKKFIVVHLLGTHMKYAYRYSEDFKRFTDRKQVPEWVKSDAAVADYNSYDNAVLYNDFVVSSLIDLTRKHTQKQSSALLYFADHGEEVYDEHQDDFKGRNEASPTRAMYTVPFILWTSKTWQKAHNVDFKPYLDRPFMTSSLIHTWAELAGLTFDELDTTRSIINPAFTPRPRMIGNPDNKKSLRDFDSLPQR